MNFDCKKGFEEAKKKLENKKEEYEQAKLILEEKVEEDKDTRNRDERIFDQKAKKGREEQARKKLDKVLIGRKKKEEINIEKQKHMKKKETVRNLDIKDSISKEDKNKITV